MDGMWMENEEVTQMLLSTFSFLLFPFLFLHATPNPPPHFSFNIISFKLWELYLAQKREERRTCDTVLICISLMQTFYIKCPTSFSFLHQLSWVDFVFGGSEVFIVR